MNILYIGSSGVLSLIPFKKLLAADITISAVGVFKPATFDKKIITLQSQSLVESLALAASARNIPVIDLSLTASAIVAQCKKYSIDIILMSCYSKRLSEEIINVPSLGCYNMHPSLLPNFRGPEPVFWQMKCGSDVGVSWHQVISDFDAGDIAIQKKIMLDDGASYSEINLQSAETGAELLLTLLSNLADASLVLTPQSSATANYYSHPEKQDFSLDVNCSAQQLYNFMCATQVFSETYSYQAGDHLFHLNEALDYDNNLTLEVAEVQGNRLYIPCNEGVLIASYTDKMPT